MDTTQLTQFLDFARLQDVHIDPQRLQVDGRIHRADVGDRPNGRNDAAYLLREDGTGWVTSRCTRYQSVGSNQNQQQIQHAQENTDATWQGAQDWSSGQMYSRQEHAARSIQQTDLANASAAPSVGAQQAWQGAADIAGQEADQNATWASWYGDRLQQDEDRQNQSAAAVQADTTGQAQAMNGAAAQSAVTSFNATMQSINAAVAAQ